MDFFFLIYIGIGFLAGFLGSLVGLGGGIIVVPALTIVLNMDIKNAIGASLVSLISTSVMTVSVLAKNNLVHFQLGLLLVSTTILGSFLGSYTAVFLNTKILLIIFASFMLVAAYMLLRKKKISEGNLMDSIPSTNGVLDLYGEIEKESGIKYFKIKRVRLGIGLSAIAGWLSGMLGVGGGIVQVPMMNLICGVPIKIAAATSSFMIGFTGLAGALVYALFGKIDWYLSASLVLGTLLGSHAGSKAAVRLKSSVITKVLVAVLIVSAVRLILKSEE
ncbi:sulfite exporter TauE/SafE family protein [bacterium]|nr:sulfite exporter TauE/SafE family protein [bacterium]